MFNMMSTIAGRGYSLELPASSFQVPLFEKTTSDKGKKHGELAARYRHTHKVLCCSAFTVKGKGPGKNLKERKKEVPTPSYTCR